MSAAVEHRTDDQIQREVLEELLWDPRVQSTKIGVAVKNGIVTLTGLIDSYARKWAAEEAAHRVRGVKAVANDIEVRLPGAADRTDAEIAEEVLHALRSEPSLKLDKPDITVSKGWVTLRGEVERQYQKEDAERAVRRLTGVRGVTNLLNVKPRAKPEDLKQEIEKALVRSAQTDAERITVEVDGTKVILKGAVRSLPERKEAERAAWSAPGVTAVENRIALAL